LKTCHLATLHEKSKFSYIVVNGDEVNVGLMGPLSMIWGAGTAGINLGIDAMLLGPMLWFFAKIGKKWRF
jgi:hypothetical protein